MLPDRVSNPGPLTYESGALPKPQRNRIGPQLSRTSLGNVLLKKKRFSADGQNIAQNCTTMRVVETTQYWTAANP